MRLLRNATMTLILLAAILPVACAAPAPTGNILDISQPLEALPGVTPASTPAEITDAIQARLDYLWEKNLSGRVYIPAGEWRLTKPLFANGDNKEIVGAGVGMTILRPADGFKGMPMLNIGTRTHFADRPVQPYNRERLTDPAHRVLDASVTGERYGLRTYGEYPATNFPRVSHLALANRAPQPWATATAYQENDIAGVNLLAMGRLTEAICVKAHTAAKENQPLTGADWQQYWVIKVPYTVQFFADPLTAGAYDPLTRRASDWQGMERFTLDFAFVQQADPAVYDGGRVLCGVIINYAARAGGRVWTLVMRPNGQLAFECTLDDGTAKSLPLATGCKATGLYRVALQVDFPTHTLQAWVQRPGEAECRRVLNDTTSLPAGARFASMEYGYFVICSGDSGGPAYGNGYHTMPTDITVCGLHTANTLRYADADTLLRRDTNGPVDDQFRYFTNDRGTIAFLPLTDHPAEGELPVRGTLVTVQHGDAAGDAAQQGYGYLHTPAQIHGVARERVSDLTIVPGPTWGVGIVTWHTLDARLWKLDIHGGYYAVADLSFGAQYTFDVRDCRLSGTEAAYNGSSNIVYFRDVTINPVGRYGILLSGSNCVLDHVTFGDPQTHRSEYYFRHLHTVDYGGMNTLLHVTANAPAGSQYPAKAAVSQCTIGPWRTSMIMQDCTVSNLGPRAAFLDLPFGASAGLGTLHLEQCRYAGTPIAAFIRAASPWWRGEVSDMPKNMPVKQWLDYQAPPSTPWTAEMKYTKGAQVSLNAQVYTCLDPHQAAPANQPGTPDGAKYWRPSLPRIVFSPVAK